MKVKSLSQGSGFAAYRHLCYGPTSLGYTLLAETLFCLLGPLPGAAGLFLRSLFYPSLFGAAGRKLLIGRNVTFRHPRKIRFGHNVIIDDNAMIDAKGDTNTGITFGDRVFIGRNSIVYCKNGNITLGEGVNVSSNCTLFSSNSLTIEAGVMIAGFTYILSGGEYDVTDRATPFVEQSGMETKGPLVIGRNCWLGAHVTVLDAAGIGPNSVIGAGAVVAKPIPADTLALGIPARVVRSLSENPRDPRHP